MVIFLTELLNFKKSTELCLKCKLLMDSFGMLLSIVKTIDLTFDSGKFLSTMFIETFFKLISLIPGLSKIQSF